MMFSREVCDPAATTVERERASDDALWHLYLCEILEDRIPGVGDVALCGFRKRRPGTEGREGPPGPDDCVVCEDLWDVIA